MAATEEDLREEDLALNKWFNLMSAAAMFGNRPGGEHWSKDVDEARDEFYALVQSNREKRSK